MKWLLDTNVICEPGKRRPNIKVVVPLDALTECDCALSFLTLGEIEKCVHPLPAVDNLLAATAVIHGLTLATRDTGDIAPGVRVFHRPLVGC